MVIYPRYILGISHDFQSFYLEGLPYSGTNKFLMNTIDNRQSSFVLFQKLDNQAVDLIELKVNFKSDFLFIIITVVLLII